ncbi:hypothetical protein R3P38DRAFT_3347511 [Favolaschia claudopus]|uniref:MYND-type domain-containing protein n=1 Tax=Favolaschia claudopus TaxID=2862362 RepID=A0AAW0CX35_9AGAR
MPPHLLTPSQISAFPARLQRAARLAADVSTPLTSLAHALHDITLECFQSTDTGHDLLLSLLSLIYGVLDPVRLPSEPDTLDVNSFRISTICAYEVLQLLGFLINHNEILPKVGRVFWPRVWRWVQLMEIHNHYPHTTLPGSPRIPILAMAGHFWRSKCTSEFVVQNSSDLGVFVAHAWDDIVALWRQYPDSTSIPHRLTFYAAITEFLRVCHYHESPELFDSIVNETGGTDKIAALLMKYISLLIVDVETADVPRDRAYLIKCLANILLFLRDGHSLWHGLVRAGYIKFNITKVVIKLARGPWTAYPLIEQAVVSCLRHLDSIISLNDEYVARALRTDLFTALCCSLRMHVAEDQAVTRILDTVVQATLHYPSIRALASIFPALETVDIRSFSDSYQTEWKFHYPGTKAPCANPECKILNIKRTELRRCAGCKLALYCSRKCQIISWSIYNHRSVCAEACSDNASEYRSTRFLHFAILRDYHAQKTDLIFNELAYTKFTRRTAFCLLFRHIAGRFLASVVFAEPYKNTIENHPAAGLPSVEIHLVELPNQPIFAIALRTSGASSMKARILQMAHKISDADLKDAAEDLARLDIVETYDSDANT